jgi:spermidine/putrescine transport system substrate-binding protein
MCIPANAPHKEPAEQFINYILEPEVGAQLSNFTHYSTPNLAALPLINETDRYNPSLYPSAEIRNRLYFAVDLGSEVTQLYDQAWEDVLATHKP